MNDYSKYDRYDRELDTLTSSNFNTSLENNSAKKNILNRLKAISKETKEANKVFL